MNNQVLQLVNYTAKRFLDTFLTSHNRFDPISKLDARDIFKDLPDGETKNIIFSNIELFNKNLEELIWNRLAYLQDEGFIYQNSEGFFEARTEEQIEEFINDIE